MKLWICETKCSDGEWLPLPSRIGRTKESGQNLLEFLIKFGERTTEYRLSAYERIDK